MVKRDEIRLSLCDIKLQWLFRYLTCSQALCFPPPLFQPVGSPMDWPPPLPVPKLGLSPIGWPLPHFNMVPKMGGTTASLPLSPASHAGLVPHGLTPPSLSPGSETGWLHIGWCLHPSHLGSSWVFPLWAHPYALSPGSQADWSRELTPPSLSPCSQAGGLRWADPSLHLTLFPSWVAPVGWPLPPSHLVPKLLLPGGLTRPSISWSHLVPKLGGPPWADPSLHLTLFPSCWSPVGWPVPPSHDLTLFSSWVVPRGLTPPSISPCSQAVGPRWADPSLHLMISPCS